jgi:DMSO/TMAO reductase YedYZ molybdopterin-dependent catalytic subunit
MPASAASTGVSWQSSRDPAPEARFVLAHAEQDYTANVPLEALEDEHALVAWEADGEPLSPDHGWPLRLVVPSR